VIGILNLNLDFSQLQVAFGFIQIPQLHAHFNSTFHFNEKVFCQDLPPCNNNEMKKRDTFDIKEKKNIIRVNCSP